MPTYEYRCDSCDQNFDVVQSFHDDALTACPTCGSPVRKVFGNVGIVFKGSGFYKTDSRAKSSTKASSGEASTPSGDGSGDSTGSGTSSDGASKSGTSDTSSSSAPASGEKAASKPTPKAPAKDKGGDSKSKT